MSICFNVFPAESLQYLKVLYVGTTCTPMTNYHRITFIFCNLK